MKTLSIVPLAWVIDPRIVAIQTDADAPRGSWAGWGAGNRHGNGWAHDYGAP